MAVRLRAARGPAVTVSDVRIDGLVSTRASVCARDGTLTGVPYDRAEALDARDQLAQLGCSAA